MCAHSTARPNQSGRQCKLTCPRKAFIRKKRIQRSSATIMLSPFSLNRQTDPVSGDFSIETRKSGKSSVKTCKYALHKVESNSRRRRGEVNRQSPHSDGAFSDGCSTTNGQTAGAKEERLASSADLRIPRPNSFNVVGCTTTTLQARPIGEPR